MAKKEVVLAPPYIPYRTFRNYIDALGVTGIPNRIDRTVLRTMSGQMQSHFIATLRYLNLIAEDGSPLTGLKVLVSPDPPTDRKQMLRLMLERRYPFLFQDFNLEGATPGELRERFEAQGIGGDTVRKCIAFFIAAATDADLKLPPHLKGRAAPRKGKRRLGTLAPNGSASVRQPPLPSEQKPKTAYLVLLELLDPHQMDNDEQQAVWTLLRYLKKQGVGV